MMNSNKVKRIYLVLMSAVELMIVIGAILFFKENSKSIDTNYVRDMAIDIMGLLVCGILLLGIFAGKNDEKQNHAMFRMNFSLSALFFLDLLTSCLEGNPKFVVAIAIVNTLAFVFEDVLGYTYWTYIRAELNLKGKFANITNKIAFISTILIIVFDVVNIKIGLFFTVSDAGEYVSSPYEFLGDIAIITIFILVIIAISRTSDKKINEKLILVSFETFPLASYMLGVITHTYTWVYPAYLLSVLLIYIRIFSEREKKIAEQQVLLTKQSTALMISQIQPHFLYNVLTTISNLCVTDPEEAEETTVLFSQYLRTNLDSLRNQEPVPFSTELMHIKTYVELEKKRFGDILSVEYDIQEQNFKVPSLGLQPIVENSIKHGIRGKNSPGHITISTYKEADKYKIIIEDDGIGFDMNQPPKDDGRSHVGMHNVEERLKQMCNASMKIESSPGNGCRTEITIPEV
ncbi:MAG: histidine kinase [Lachnospiraceae bacterium]|nr:histidine kinase [Lachnospiraceae bacterium]